MQLLASAPDDSLDDVRQKEEFYAELAQDDEYIKARLLADAWCAAFVWAKRQDTDLPLTDLLYRHLERDPQAENLQGGAREGSRADRPLRLLPLARGFPRCLSSAG